MSCFTARRALAKRPWLTSSPENWTASCHTRPGPALERPADVVGLLSNLNEGDVIFIDEIHRLSTAVEEYLYSAMEDYRIDFVTGSGAFAKTISLPVDRFTLVGSTTRAGMLSAPLRERFGLAYHLDFYSEPELATVVTRSAGILRIDVEPDAASEIARRARGTPPGRKPPTQASKGFR